MLRSTVISIATIVGILPYNIYIKAIDIPMTSVHKQLVPVQIFYRPYCAACQWYMTDPIVKLVNNEGFRNIINLKIYPAAGIVVRNDKLECESGELECIGSKWQACAIKQDHDDIVKIMQSISCLESYKSGDLNKWDEKIEYCFKGKELVTIKKCFAEESEKLIRDMIPLADIIEWMPYTIVDKKVLGTATTGVSLDMLQKNICSAYNGSRSYYPEECETLVGHRELPDDKVNEPPQPMQPAEKLEKDVPNVVQPKNAIEVEKIKLEVYWRAFCPGCMGFMSKTLPKLLQNEQFRNIIEFIPVPAVGMHEDGNGDFTCHMGLAECMGHRYLSCTIKEFPVLEDMISRIKCIESKEHAGGTWEGLLNVCFPDADEKKRIKNCYDNESTELLRQHVQKRKKIHVKWAPYVRINEELLGDAKHGISFNVLRTAICKAYKGDSKYLPDACKVKKEKLRKVDDQADQQDNQDGGDDEPVKPCPPKKKDEPLSDNEKEEHDLFIQEAPHIGRRKVIPVDVDEKEAGAGAAVDGHVNDFHLPVQEEVNNRVKYNSELGHLGSGDYTAPLAVVCFLCLAYVGKKIFAPNTAKKKA